MGVAFGDLGQTHLSLIYNQAHYLSLAFTTAPYQVIELLRRIGWKASTHPHHLGNSLLNRRIAASVKRKIYKMVLRCYGVWSGDCGTDANWE